ncbi:MAG: hypothetical protein OEX07_14680 [Gammaproteobacteria bacterium]|nr:hypothetical protein [Gammaproteobacteria bacterium]
MGRGDITHKAAEIAKRLLNHPKISQSEIRLLPYLQYLAINQKGIEGSSISNVEYHIIKDWAAKRWLLGDPGIRVSMPPYVWYAVSEILWETYADASTHSPKADRLLPSRRGPEEQKNHV